jgi:hypothetical protein
LPFCHLAIARFGDRVIGRRAIEGLGHPERVEGSWFSGWSINGFVILSEVRSRNAGERESKDLGFRRSTNGFVILSEVRSRNAGERESKDLGFRVGASMDLSS